MTETRNLEAFPVSPELSLRERQAEVAHVEEIISHLDPAAQRAVRRSISLRENEGSSAMTAAETETEIEAS